jgi:guanine deaminase
VFTCTYFLIDILSVNLINPVISGLQKYNIFHKKKEYWTEFIHVNLNCLIFIPCFVIKKSRNIMDNDSSLLLRAIQIAIEGIEKGGGPFGAVIAKDGKILSEAVNRVVLNSDPTAHAEVSAIREAAAVLKSHDLKDCTLYCSCEPCPMCLGAIYWSGITKVVYSCDRIDAAAAGFSDKDIYDEIMIEPDERRIRFVKLDITGGEEVFRKWENHDGKIPY